MILTFRIFHILQAKMVSLKVSRAVVVAALLSRTLAHPGHDLTQEIAERNEFLQHSKRASNCDVALRKRGIDSKQNERRQLAIEQARAARGLPQSELYSVLNWR